MDLIYKILSHTATDAEQKKHREMLADAEYQKEYEAQTCIWHESSKTFSNYDVNTDFAWKALSVKTTLRKDKNTLFTWMKYAAAILFILSGSLLFINSQFGEEVLMVYQSGDQTKEVTLADGSVIYMNRYSSIEIMEGFNKNDRKIALKGEAFFDIQRDEEKPFIISCDGTETQVLGTSFNIYSDLEEETIELNVKTGLVAFKRKRLLFDDEAEKVGAGESCVYDKKSGELTKSSKNADNYLSWKTKTIAFQNTGILEVCKVLSHDFHQTITCRGTKLEEVSVTVTFENEKLKDVLDIIAIALNAEVIEAEDQLIIQLE